MSDGQDRANGAVRQPACPSVSLMWPDRIVLTYQSEMGRMHRLGGQAAFARGM